MSKQPSFKKLSYNHQAMLKYSALVFVSALYLPYLKLSTIRVPLSAGEQRDRGFIENLFTFSLHPSFSPPCVPAVLGCTASRVQLRPCQNPIWNVSNTSLESNGFHWTELWPAVCRQSVTYWWSRTPYVAFQIKWYKECDSVEKHLSLAIFSTLH